MAKYTPLTAYLRREAGFRNVVRMSFLRLEGIIDARLPSSAFRHQAWWSNEVGGNHVQAHAWMNAGRRVDGIDLAHQEVTFVHTG